MTAKNAKVAVVVGVGPGTGAALARRFSHEYAVALVARGADKLKAIAEEIRGRGGEALEVPADVTSATEVHASFDGIRAKLGPPDVLLYNAGSGTWGTIAEVTPEQFEASWRTNAFGAFLCAREVAPEMVSRGRGAIVFTGATAGMKAGPKSVAFGPAKFATRGLAQSLARDLGPKGVHVAWVNIDGVIDVPGRSLPMKSEDLIRPEAIAETFWFLAHQDRSAWTMETEIRPFKEKF
ncbi:MAG TPA: SDR family NAD(P)-dependent oxidoreductase [Polyangiaceae bacterium]|jgi:NAD(P)-dependent dehydrogenase (short-subunit alcohol dehydrogenase family)